MVNGIAASNKAEAPGQAAGYVFQLRYALHRALERLRRDPTAAIAIEKHDDVSIITDSGVVTVDQLKHTTQDEEEIGDYSKAIWRTVGNWLRLLNSGAVELIPSLSDHHWCAHSRKPIDMMVQGWSTSLFHAAQQWSRMSV